MNMPIKLSLYIHIILKIVSDINGPLVAILHHNAIQNKTQIRLPLAAAAFDAAYPQVCPALTLRVSVGGCCRSYKYLSAMRGVHANNVRLRASYIEVIDDS
jgi:hypothetical protein